MTPRTQSEPPERIVDCMTIVNAVAKRKGVPVTDLQSPLYDVINPEALETLLNPTESTPPSPVEVCFEYAGCRILVSSDGTLTIE